MMNNDRIIKIPIYWGELWKGLEDREVGIIIEVILAYASGDLTHPAHRKLFSLSDNGVEVFDKCLEDIRYQDSHPRAYKKPDGSREIRNSPEYSAWRHSVYERDNYTCQNCGKHGGKINAHHIKPFAKFPALRLDISNGVTLCTECHKLAHKRGFRYA